MWLLILKEILLSKLMMGNKFEVLVAIGIAHGSGAVLSVTADDDVREAILFDIREDGDREFIDSLGSGIPGSGVVKITAKMKEWPTEHEPPVYELISAKNVLFANIDET